mmetsp:Transcript_11214/g.24109  ORF Transcript_11214/g.24109 Transcript_11214/m.24109 type:complete len:156 (-) Transcript_11214:883-1350(-)
MLGTFNGASFLGRTGHRRNVERKEPVFTVQGNQGSPWGFASLLRLILASIMLGTFNGASFFGRTGNRRNVEKNVICKQNNNSLFQVHFEINWPNVPQTITLLGIVPRKTPQYTTQGCASAFRIGIGVGTGKYSFIRLWEIVGSKPGKVAEVHNSN